MKTSIPSVLITFGLVCIALVQNTQAVSPAPDGGYPGGNTAEGQSALLGLTTGTFNTAVGFESLLSLTDGKFCTGVGAGTLLANTAQLNTAVGAGALLSNTTGFGSTANGAFALFNNTTGLVNTASGVEAALNNTIGSNNTADGEEALENSTGDHNTAVGDSALRSLTAGSSNTALGSFAGINVTTADRVICIGNSGANVSGACFIGNIRDVQTQNADTIAVLVDSAGQLGTQSSSRRFKKEIKSMDSASEGILALKPVTFQYKSDKKNAPQYGLIAEEVAKVNPDLVVRDKNGEIYTVRYDAVNAMLLNEFLKEHRKVEDLKKDFQATVAQQQKEIAALAATVKEQASQIQKVSAQLAAASPSRGGLEASEAAPQVVNNNP
jgi:uncharacterized coiled-coil protein SlyX